MPKALGLVVLIVALGLAAPALAGDIVDMPTGNMVAPRNFEFNYIFWDLELPPGAPEYVNIFEFFVGVTDWLEVDAIVADVESDKTYVWGNAYLRLIAETPNRPSLIVGATNLTGADVPAGLETDISPFVLSSYNINVPEGPPSLEDPLVRLHVAYGTGYHTNRFFGGVQILVTPRLGFGAFGYQGQGAYMVAYRPMKQLELRAGWKNDDPFYSAGWFANW